MEQTITEHDLDPKTQHLVDSFADADGEPDLAVDGLGESLASRLLRLVMFRGS